MVLRRPTALIMDVHSKKVRSYNMSQIKAKNTQPELIVRKFLHSNGYRFRLHYSRLPGKPDIALPKYKTVIQVNGCFWHSHEGCKNFVLPKTNVDWWKEKLEKTKFKDRANEKKLKSLGWNLITVWECELSSVQRDKTLHNLLTFFRENIVSNTS